MGGQGWLEHAELGTAAASMRRVHRVTCIGAASLLPGHTRCLLAGGHAAAAARPALLPAPPCLPPLQPTPTHPGCTPGATWRASSDESERSASPVPSPLPASILTNVSAMFRAFSSCD